MTKRILFIILFLYPICFGSAYSGSGDGNSTSPYLIDTYAHLLEMQDGNITNRLTSYWKLTADINAADSCSLDGGKGWIPIGDHDFASFTGGFDGNGYTISNLFIKRIDGWDSNFVGFFGGAWTPAQIQNLYLKDVNIVGNGYVGAFAGNLSGTATKCHSSGKVVSNFSRAGGFCGKCHDAGVVTNCYSDVNVTLVWGDGGGFCGENIGSITNCYSTGKVSGGYFAVGGFCGVSYGTNGVITGCHYDKETSGRSDTGKGDPNTTADMKKQATFTGWNFDTVWAIVEDITYPHLYVCSPMDSDLDTDCQVNFFDYAILANEWQGDWLDILDFAEEWLTCNRNPPSECGQ